MTRSGKTFKDIKDYAKTRQPKDPRPAEKGGHKNLIKEALEDEAFEKLFPKVDETDEFPKV